MIKSICIFGDSTAWGAWDMEKGGWANRLMMYVSEKTDGECEVYNLSISGGTSQTILDRFESEARIRNVDAFIFQTGGNDSRLLSKEGPNAIPIDKYRENLTETIAKTKNITDNIVFVGFKEVNESLTNPVPWDEASYYLNSEIRKYNDVMEEVCKERGIQFLNILGLLSHDDLEDGIHPNVQGHIKIFDLVKNSLEENKWI